MKKGREREVGRIIPLMLGEEAAMHIRTQHRTWERSFERAIREAGLENCGRNLLESLMERALSASEEQAKAEKQAKAEINRGHDSEEERCPICMDDFALEVNGEIESSTLTTRRK
ncbi:hypothetical protein L1049_025327 [Liquidambar formosana]|uniref:Uncharacterized protein n=1 Tax=Liquidambar formosana TaxID=63359 RepID=A0AAP0N3T3_LIQFO